MQSLLLLTAAVSADSSVCLADANCRGEGDVGASCDEGACRCTEGGAYGPPASGPPVCSAPGQTEATVTVRLRWDIRSRCMTYHSEVKEATNALVISALGGSSNVVHTVVSCNETSIAVLLVVHGAPLDVFLDEGAVVSYISSHLNDSRHPVGLAFGPFADADITIGSDDACAPAPALSSLRPTLSDCSVTSCLPPHTLLQFSQHPDRCWKEGKGLSRATKTSLAIACILTGLVVFYALWLKLWFQPRLIKEKEEKESKEKVEAGSRGSEDQEEEGTGCVPTSSPDMGPTEPATQDPA